MRMLFYIGEPSYSGSARAFISAARGLAARDHQVIIACCGQSPVERAVVAAGLEFLRIDPTWFFGADAWGLRRLLQDRFVEVVYVHTDREQLVVSAALRMAERGAVIRRVPAFAPVSIRRSGRFALRAAAAGLLFSTEQELRAARTEEMPIPPMVAPLGVDVAAYEGVRPIPRANLGVGANTLLIVCVYERLARTRLQSALRTLSILAPRHPDMHMLVLGAHADDDDLRLHAAALGVTRRVSFLGDRDDALSVMRSADVGWVAAAHDDAAFAFLDFMAMRIPVISERGALPQHFVADQIAGLLLSQGDSTHTASTVAAFFAQAERRTAMGNAGRARVQREFPETALVDGFERAADAASNRERWALR